MIEIVLSTIGFSMAILLLMIARCLYLESKLIGK